MNDLHGWKRGWTRFRYLWRTISGVDVSRKQPKTKRQLGHPQPLLSHEEVRYLLAAHCFHPACTPASCCKLPWCEEVNWWTALFYSLHGGMDGGLVKCTNSGRSDRPSQRFYQSMQRFVWFFLYIWRKKIRFQKDKRFVLYIVIYCTVNMACLRVMHDAFSSLAWFYPEALFSSQKFSRFPVTLNFWSHAWSIKYRWKYKLIAQFICNLWDESFEPKSNSNSLTNYTWQISIFAKSKSQMPSGKKRPLQQWAIWSWQIKISWPTCMNYLGRCRAVSLRRRCPVHRTWPAHADITRIYWSAQRNQRPRNTCPTQRRPHWAPLEQSPRFI